jgi:hypothetical protein
MLPNQIDPGKLLGFRLAPSLLAPDGISSTQVGSAIGMKAGLKPVVPGDGDRPTPQIGPQISDW